MSTRGRRAEAWTRAALSPPRAHGAPLAAARLRPSPRTFAWRRSSPSRPSGAGPHRLLRVRSARPIPAGSRPSSPATPGYRSRTWDTRDSRIGMRSVVQWFSVPAARRIRGILELGAYGRVPGARVARQFAQAQARRASRQPLPHPAAQGRLAARATREKLAALRTQRGAELFRRAALRPRRLQPRPRGRWCTSGAAAGRAERGFALSAARALMFNAVLARRVQAPIGRGSRPGDLASLDGSGSHFRVAGVDAELRRRSETSTFTQRVRCGGAESPNSGPSLATRARGGARIRTVADLLAPRALSQERRALRCAVRELSVEADAGTLTLSFSLGRGQFATAVLREICDLAEPARRSTWTSRRAWDDAALEASAQQHVHRAGAAVDGSRRGERHHVGVAPEPGIHGDLEHGPRAPERYPLPCTMRTQRRPARAASPR